MSDGIGGVAGNARAELGSHNVHRNYLSADGRSIAFASEASNLVAGDSNGASDVFVRDRQVWATTRVSVSSAGAQANGASSEPALSADGRWMVFQSAASNLVVGDTNGKIDVFAREILLGVTTRVSVTTSGAQANGHSLRPDISADGRWIVWHSEATNLVTSDSNAALDIFLHDRATGQTNRLSVDSAGLQADGQSLGAAISASGRFVAFHSFAANLVGGDTNGQADVFVRDRATFLTTRTSTSTGGVEANSGSESPSLSADGRFVTFTSHATNLVPGDNNGVRDVFVKDRLSSATELVSVTATGAQGNAASEGATITADGRFVAFMSAASNLVPGDTNGGIALDLTDVFVRDRLLFATNRVSVDDMDRETDGGSSIDACVARDGSGVAFYSPASNLAVGDGNGFADVFFKNCASQPWPAFFCAGDGWGLACPCGNTGYVGHGCENSFWTGGAELGGAGLASVSNDALTLLVNGLPPTTPILFFQGDAVVNFGLGLPFGDGLRCVGGNVLRLGAHTSASGTALFGAGVPGDPPISTRGAVLPGTISLRYYQAWYRNTVAYCTAEGFNLTNGIVVTWLP